jgi:hypothetical protein
MTRERRRTQEDTAMTSDKKTSVGRRDFLRALGAGAGVAVTAAGPLATSAHADSETNEEKRKARYQPNSPEVQTYYRVNRYPSK